jgi:cytochrome d ubiquinol oxidase subunit I
LVGVAVGVAGVASGVPVVSANGWMNSPTGFVWENGMAHSIDPIAALILRGSQDPMHRLALKIALTLGAVAAILQPVSGHFTTQSVAERQPVKLAALEAHFETQAHAPIILGGIPDEATGEVHYGLEIPSALSVLAFDDPAATVRGLHDFPRDEWPPVLIVHFAFQIMVGIGTLLLLVGLLSLVGLRFRPGWLGKRRFLQLVVCCAPLGFVAMESGWVVTEVGRQPWIIYGIMRTSEALTPVPGQVFHLVGFGLLYLLIGASTVWMWSRQVGRARPGDVPSDAIRRWAFGGDA